MKLIQLLDRRIWVFVFFGFFALIMPAVLMAAEALPKTQQNLLSLGVNKFDLALQYQGLASGGDGALAYRKVTLGMARKSLDDARDNGIRFVRVAVAGFAPSAQGGRSDLRLWQESPSIYWAEMDQMMDELDARGIRLVPVLMWNVGQFPALSQQTVTDLVSDGSSPAWMLLERYVTEFVTRYRGRPTILFYELTNELNLMADLDNTGRCERERRGLSCDVWGNFSTDDMISFLRRFAILVKRLDKSHAVSSGFSVPRPNAEYLRRHPSWEQNKVAQGTDSRSQFKKNLQDIHAPVDIISVHLYDNPQNYRFGSSDVLDLLAAAKEAADEMGKPIFVGEFGEPSLEQTGPGGFVSRMLKKLPALGIPFASVWVWEFYQRKTYLTHDNPHTAFSLEPGQTDFLIERLAYAARGGQSQPAIKQGPDKVPPRVVLTWPLPCAILDANQELFAVASDDRGQVARLEFGIDGKTLFVDDKPPYAGRLDTAQLDAGSHILSATAFDGAENRTSWTSPVLIRPLPKAKSECLRSNLVSD